MKKDATLKLYLKWIIFYFFFVFLCTLHKIVYSQIIYLIRLYVSRLLIFILFFFGVHWLSTFIIEKDTSKEILLIGLCFIYRETTPVAVEKEVEDVDAAAPKVAEEEVKEKAVENGTKTVDAAEAVAATPSENGTATETPAADEAAAIPAVADAATEESKAADTTATEEKVAATETEHKNGNSTG